MEKPSPLSLDGKRGWIVLLIGIGFLGYGFWGLLPDSHTYHGTLLDPAVTPPSLELSDQHGETVSWEDLEGMLTLVYFGYTHCPDFCPTTLSNIARALELLGVEESRVETLMVTVDPERDTPERLADYLDNFNPRFRGLTGEPEQLRRVANGFGVQNLNQPAGPSGVYLIDHTTTLWAVDPSGNIRVVFPPESSPTQLAADLTQLLGST